MAERKIITSLSVITDSETSYDKIGDIDGGGFDLEWLKQHIKSHGTEALFNKIAWMNYQVYDALRLVNNEKYTQLDKCNDVTRGIPSDLL